ncbi:MAG: tetratricopeptide repeat protein [Burkholderiaceae bacterium]
MKRLSLDLPKLFALVACQCFLVMTTALVTTEARAEATTLNNNYYAAPGNTDLMQLLRNNEETHLGKAKADLATGRPHRIEYAIADFDYILTRWPNHPQALLGLFDAARRLKRPQLFQRYSKAAIEVAPEAAPTYVIIGAYLMRQGNAKDAEPMLAKALELNPESINAHYNLGLLYAQTQRLEQANRHAQKAYSMGHPMPGLRKRLEAAGAWKPLPGTPTPPTERAPQ